MHKPTSPSAPNLAAKETERRISWKDAEAAMSYSSSKATGHAPPADDTQPQTRSFFCAAPCGLREHVQLVWHVRNMCRMGKLRHAFAAWASWQTCTKAELPAALEKTVSSGPPHPKNEALLAAPPLHTAPVTLEGDVHMAHVAETADIAIEAEVAAAAAAEKAAGAEIAAADPLESSSQPATSMDIEDANAMVDDPPRLDENAANEAAKAASEEREVEKNRGRGERGQGKKVAKTNREYQQGKRAKRKALKLQSKANDVGNYDDGSSCPDDKLPSEGSASSSFDICFSAARGTGLTPPPANNQNRSSEAFSTEFAESGAQAQPAEGASRCRPGAQAAEQAIALADSSSDPLTHRPEEMSCDVGVDVDRQDDIDMDTRHAECHSPGPGESPLQPTMSPSLSPKPLQEDTLLSTSKLPSPGLVGSPSEDAGFSEASHEQSLRNACEHADRQQDIDMGTAAFPAAAILPRSRKEIDVAMATSQSQPSNLLVAKQELAAALTNLTAAHSDDNVHPVPDSLRSNASAQIPSVSTPSIAGLQVPLVGGEASQDIHMQHAPAIAIPGVDADVVTAPAVQKPQYGTLAPRPQHNAAIETKLSQFGAAKKVGDFATVDAIRLELRTQGVDADMVTAIAVLNLKYCMPVHLSQHDVAIGTKLSQFEAAKQNGDFATVDAIRMELRTKGVDADTVKDYLLEPDAFQDRRQLNENSFLQEQVRKLQREAASWPDILKKSLTEQRGMLKIQLKRQHDSEMLCLRQEEAKRQCLDCRLERLHLDGGLV